MLRADPPLYSLFHIGNSIQVLNKRSERRFGLSLVQWYLLRRLVRMPACSPQDLATAVGVSPGTLTQSMRRLERKRLLFVADDPHDSRRKMVSITRAGKNLLEEASEKIDEWSADFSPLKKEIQQIRTCLSRQVEREN